MLITAAYLLIAPINLHLGLQLEITMLPCRPASLAYVFDTRCRVCPRDYPLLVQLLPNPWPWYLDVDTISNTNGCQHHSPPIPYKANNIRCCYSSPPVPSLAITFTAIAFTAITIRRPCCSQSIPSMANTAHGRPWSMKLGTPPSQIDLPYS